MAVTDIFHKNKRGLNILLIFAVEYQRVIIINQMRFLLYPIVGNRQILQSETDRQSKKRSCLPCNIHSPARGNDDKSARRGSGLFIFQMGVWRCLSDDKLTFVPRFFLCNIIIIRICLGTWQITKNYENFSSAGLGTHIANDKLSIKCSE